MDAEFWSKVNSVMNNDDRVSFNEWRSKLCTVADEIRDRSRRMSSDARQVELAESLIELVDMLPSMRK